MSEQQTDTILELRTLARKAFITFREQDAARLREAADALERLRAALDTAWKLSVRAQAELDNGELSEVNGSLVEIAELAAAHAALAKEGTK
jgi:hypothetical protein